MDSDRTNSLIAIFDSEHFPQSNAAAESSVEISRRRRVSRGDTISAEWDQDDHLLSLRSRLGPLRVLGKELFSAAIRAHSVLWPGSEASKSIQDLAVALQGSEQRLREWRHSSARAGADEALAWVLSWYEKINLDALAEMRGTSKWLNDPALISRRQERAFAIAKYADTRAYIAGDDESEPKDEEDGEAEAEVEDSDTDYADSGVGDDDEEPVDEEIQVDQAPSRSAGTESESRVETQTGATESRAEADANIVEPATKTQASAPESRAEAQATAPEAQTGAAESRTPGSTDEALKLAADIAAQAASETAASNPIVDA